MGGVMQEEARWVEVAGGWGGRCNSVVGYIT